MEEAQWKPVPGHAGYEISSHGQVRRTDIFDAQGRLVSRSYVISQRLTGPAKARYYEVSLRTLEPSVRIRRKVHHLILEAFVGPRPEGLKACHNNGDRVDNRLSNLRWDTQASNVRDMVRHGVHWNTAKTHCKRGHEFTPDNVYANGQGRKCKTCARERSATQYAAKKAETSQ